jgi:hypothetical protein
MRLIVFSHLLIIILVIFSFVLSRFKAGYYFFDAYLLSLLSTRPSENPELNLQLLNIVAYPHGVPRPLSRLVTPR